MRPDIGQVAFIYPVSYQNLGINPLERSRPLPVYSFADTAQRGIGNAQIGRYMIGRDSVNNIGMFIK